MRESRPPGSVRGASSNGCPYRDRLGRDPEWPETALLDAFVLPPGVIAGEVNVVPMDRRHMLKQAFVDLPPLLAKRPDRALQISGIPQNNRGNHQVEAAGAVTLRLKAAIAQFP